MTTANAIVVSVAMLCVTLCFIVFWLSHSARRAVDNVLQRVKELDSDVTVNVDKKIDIAVNRKPPAPGNAA